MPYLPPNQQHQSTEGKKKQKIKEKKLKIIQDQQQSHGSLYQYDILAVFYSNTLTDTTVLQILYSSTCVSHHPEIKLEDFVTAKFYACMPSLMATNI